MLKQIGSPLEKQKSPSLTNNMHVVWIQQFESYATAIQFKQKKTAVQAAMLMALLGPQAINLCNSFNLTEAHKNVNVIKQKFENH